MISIDKNSNISLYEQLYSELKKAIISGELPAGSRLPSTRSLASQYSISRNTVVTAYNQLYVEGFVTSRPGSGFYIEQIPEAIEITSKNSPADIPPLKKEPHYKYDFSYGSLDFNIYRNRKFREAVKDAWAREENKDSITYESSQGSPHLRESMSRMLLITRGVHADPNQIIVTSGHYYSLFLLTVFFKSTDYSLLMEDPGYQATRDVFMKERFSISYLPLEKDGITTSFLPEKKKSLLYITPSHQYPMGSILPIKKRMEILNWAAATGSYIIEDDYDSELRYRDMPVPSLQSIDKNNRVIYMGTFSKSTSPDLRTSYIVMPKGFPVELTKRLPCLSAAVPEFIEEALARYIENGSYEKHISTIRTYFRRKHDLIVSYFKTNFPDKVKIHGTGGGVHFLLEINTTLTTDEIIETAKKQNVRVYDPRMFWANPKKAPQNMVLIGYGGIPMDNLGDYLYALGKCISAT